MLGAGMWCAVVVVGGVMWRSVLRWCLMEIDEENEGEEENKE